MLYDNEADAATMENHANREEIKEAMETGIGKAARYSKTFMEKTLYYALRLDSGTVIRVSCTQNTVGTLLLGCCHLCCGFWCWCSFCRLFLLPASQSVSPDPSTR